jgi:hypothetical protein
MGNQSSKSHKDKYKKNVHWKSAGNGFEIKFENFSDKKNVDKKIFSRRNKRRKSFAVIFSSLNV